MRGELRAVITTDALELGIDIGELDAAVVVTFPGTVASLRQMWGRAGRRGRGLAVYVAGEDALDQFFCRHPDDFLDRPVEAAILDHESPLIYRAHLLCAAHEGPLVARRRRVPRARAGRPTPSCSSAPASCAAPARGGERRRQRRDLRAARRRRLPGARRCRCARPRRRASRSSTSPRASCSARPRPRARTRPCTTARSTCTWGAPTRCASSTSSAGARSWRRSTATGTPSPSARPTPTIERLLDRREALGVTLSLRRGERHRHRARLPAPAPVRPRADRPRRARPAATSFSTQALWFELDAAELRTETIPLESLLGALHATEHAQIAVLPLIAMCDRWDIGGLSTNFHPQTGAPTIFIYDGHPGGIGIARTAFARFEELCERRPPADRRVPLRGAAAPPACSRRSAATSTSRSPRRARGCCSSGCSRRRAARTAVRDCCSDAAPQLLKAYAGRPAHARAR